MHQFRRINITSKLQYLSLLQLLSPRLTFPPSPDHIPYFCPQGDGPKLVRELFRVAEEHAPSIVFIDEIDAIGTKRYDSNSGGEREIQRTMLELLNQLDGFDSRGDVKVGRGRGGSGKRCQVGGD